MASINDATGSSFEEHLQATTMPPPGPDHFNARRAVWCKARPDRTQPTDTTGQRERLEAVLNQEGAVESDDVWEVQGVKQAWSRIMDGRRLRQRLPLRVVIKLLWAGWIHDGTWPRGAVAPGTDDELKIESIPESIP